jgi:hypothetical protein
MSAPTPKTVLETAIERRDFYQGRLVENMVNVIYFTRQLKTLKKDTQERVNAKANIENAQNNIKNDEALLAAFDILIEQVTKESK